MFTQPAVSDGQLNGEVAGTNRAFLSKQEPAAAFPLALRLQNALARIQHSLTSATLVRLSVVPRLLHVLHQNVVFRRLFRPTRLHQRLQRTPPILNSGGEQSQRKVLKRCNAIVANEFVGTTQSILPHKTILFLRKPRTKKSS